MPAVGFDSRLFCIEEETEMEYPGINMKATGANIKAYVKKNAYSAEKVRMFLCMSDKSCVYKWFRGESLPSLDNLFALSMLLKVSMNDLLIENAK